MYGFFKSHTGEIALEKTEKLMLKGNLQRETESLLIVAENRVMRNNCIKAIIDNISQNSKRWLRGERDKCLIIN